MSTVALLCFLLFCAVVQTLHRSSQGSLQSTDPSLLWGPYRPNIYFGIRPRIPNSLLMGLMWSAGDEPSKVTENLRHTCEQNEGVAGYGWETYDARKGGIQVVNDTGNQVDLTTSFIKSFHDTNGSNWGLRIRGVPRADTEDLQQITVVFYLGIDDFESIISCKKDETAESIGNVAFCDGTAAGVGNFSLKITTSRADRFTPGKMSVKSLKVESGTLWQAKSIFVNQLKHDDDQSSIFAEGPGEGNLHYVQQSFQGEFEFDVLFSSGTVSDEMTSLALTTGMRAALSTFEERFHSVYSPQAPFHDDQHVKFSQALLANLMGGIGYFHGMSKVDKSAAPEDDETNESFGRGVATTHSSSSIHDQGPYQLFSATPSRSFFPRGFFWDEGFHLEVIMDWDMDLALDIVSSWFDLIDDDGWIAREQILGPEARSKVPEQFQTQYPHYGNPPTLFLIIQAFVARLNDTTLYSGAPSQYLSHLMSGRKFLKAIYPRLKMYYDWFRRTQAGKTEHYYAPMIHNVHGYRWRGRTPQHVLTSGLDDYPRAKPPHLEELHVDALSWVGSMAMALRYISAFLGEERDEANFKKQTSEVLQSIDSIHWSDADYAYCDTTMTHKNHVEKICHKGYISLFPFLVGLMGADHTHLGAVLDLIWDPDELWSSHGIRSLSRKDKYYGTDENYWRSPVWININYMVLLRLLELAQKPGPHRHKAHNMYTQLRLNLVNTVFGSWKETGFAWEHYNPETGKGQGTQSFMGWTSLIVRIMHMPNLQGESSARRPKHGRTVVSMTTVLYLAVVVMLLLCFLFRRRHAKIWRGVTKT